MKLVARLGSEGRLVFAMTIIPFFGFFGTKDCEGPVFVAMAVVALGLLSFNRWTSNAASSLTLDLDAGELEARFLFRRAVRISLSRIAAIEVHRRNWLTRGEPLVFATIVAKDEPTVIEVTAESWEVERFLAIVADNAKRVGVKDVTPFTLPRGFWIRELAPAAVVGALCLLAPSRFSWPAVAWTAGAFVLHALLTRSRYAVIANATTTSDADARREAKLDEWSALLRASSR